MLTQKERRAAMSIEKEIIRDEWLLARRLITAALVRKPETTGSFRDWPSLTMSSDSTAEL
jgi:hypothetical protein